MAVVTVVDAEVAELVVPALQPMKVTLTTVPRRRERAGRIATEEGRGKFIEAPLVA